MRTVNVDPAVLSGGAGGMLFPDKQFGLNGLHCRQVTGRIPDQADVSLGALVDLSLIGGIEAGEVRPTLH